MSYFNAFRVYVISVLLTGWPPTVLVVKSTRCLLSSVIGSSSKPRYTVDVFLAIVYPRPVVRPRKLYMTRKPLRRKEQMHREGSEMVQTRHTAAPPAATASENTIRVGKWIVWAGAGSAAGTRMCFFCLCVGGGGCFGSICQLSLPLLASSIFQTLRDSD